MRGRKMDNQELQKEKIKLKQTLEIIQEVLEKEQNL